MAAVIPFTTIEGVIAALAKIDVMHKHMATTSEGKVHKTLAPRVQRCLGAATLPSTPPPLPRNYLARALLPRCLMSTSWHRCKFTWSPKGMTCCGTARASSSTRTRSASASAIASSASWPTSGWAVRRAFPSPHQRHARCRHRSASHSSLALHTWAEAFVHPVCLLLPLCSPDYPPPPLLTTRSP